MSTVERKVFDKFPFDVTECKFDYKGDGNLDDYYQVGPKKYFMGSYKECGLDIYNFEARSDDVYLVGYPRSGTTLHSEMVWLIGNDLNYEEARNNFSHYRFPHIDFNMFYTIDAIKHELSNKTDVSDEEKEIARKYEELRLDNLAKRKGRRFIKSHLPFSLMPPHIFEVGAKVIYCARNPKDVIVSSYKTAFFFIPTLDEKKFTFERYLEIFMNDKGWYCPYFEHVKEAWARRNDKNFLFLFYEDTIRDMNLSIRKVANFLGKELSNRQIKELEDYLHFDNFKNNKSVNLDQLVKVGIRKNDKVKFIRRGKVGGWREYFTGDMEESVNKWMEKNLKGSDLKFPDI